MHPLINDEQVGELLRAAAESIFLDFKERLVWDDPAHRFAICKDIAALANASGGHLIIGVAEPAPGRFEWRGLAADDPLPDATTVNTVLRNLFDPAIRVEVAERTVDGRQYGVIEVSEFPRYPHICQREGGVPGSPPVLRPADIYVRTEALSSERAGPAAVRRIVERAVTKTGAAVAEMVGQRPAIPAAQEPPAGTTETIGRFPTRRTLDLSPSVATEPVRIGRLEQLVVGSRVDAPGGPLMPRQLDLNDGTAWIREPNRILMEGERDWGRGPVLSVIEATTALRVRIAESLWEDTSDVLEEAFDITTLFRFIYAGLLFAFRLYPATGVERIRVAASLTSPLNRVLTVDPAGFEPFMRDYRSSTRQDLRAEREVLVDDLATDEYRSATTADMAEELLEYWGFRIQPATRDAQLAAARRGVIGA